MRLIGPPTRHRLMGSNRPINWTRRLLQAHNKRAQPRRPNFESNSRAQFRKPNLKIRYLKCSVATLSVINITHDVAWMRMYDVKWHEYTHIRQSIKKVKICRTPLGDWKYPEVKFYWIGWIFLSYIYRLEGD
jgi:hypothetical protein